MIALMSRDNKKVKSTTKNAQKIVDIVGDQIHIFLEDPLNVKYLMMKLNCTLRI